MSAWYYVSNGQRLGPLKLQALRKLREDDAVGDTTPVWTADMPGWTPYGQVPTLSLAAPQRSSAVDPEITEDPKRPPLGPCCPSQQRIEMA